MATQSLPPQKENPHIPESTKQANMDEKDFKEDAANDLEKAAISEPLREDQVQNAVKFLSHPKVRGSPVIYRRSFLEKKGLTKEEIDEAFHRVPDPPSNETNLGPPSAVPAPQAKIPIRSQPRPPTQVSQTSSVHGTGIPADQRLMQSRFHWTHALYAIGFLAASGAGTALLFKNIVVPRFKSWIKKVVDGEKETETEDTSSNLAEEAAAATKTAASAAEIVAKISQDLLSSKNEERKYFEAFMGALDAQVKELKSMSYSIQKLESRNENGYYQENTAGEYIQSTAGNDGSVSNSWRKSQYAQVNGTANTEYGEVRTFPSSVAVEPAFSKPYMPGKIPSVPQRMEKASGVMPWEAARLSREHRSYDVQSQSSDDDSSSKVQETFGSSQLNGKSGDSSQPWWLKKNVTIAEMETQGTESRQSTYISDTPEKPKQRSWVPPQPPTVTMPEAAAAIRHPKPSTQKQRSEDELSLSNSENGDEAGSMRTVKPRAEENLSGVLVQENQSEIQEIQDGHEI